MNTDQFNTVGQFFYVIQNLARCYYFLSVLPLKKQSNKNIILFCICMVLAPLVSYFMHFNIVQKGIMDIVLTFVIFSYFNRGRFFTKILYYVISFNALMLTEMLGVWIVTGLFHIDFNTLSSSNIIIMIMAPATLLVCIFHFLLSKLLKKRSVELGIKYIVGVVILTIIQSIIMYVEVLHFAFLNSLYIYPVLAACILLTYFLMKYISIHIYAEYKYKENTLYFIKQYEEQLKDYFKLKDNEQEIQYLRHEIMNQLQSIKMKRED